MGKRGLSAVVTTLVIILLAIVSIGIVWVVVQNVITEGASQISIGSFSEDIELQNVLVEGDAVKVSVKRNSGTDQMEEINFIFENGTSSQTIVRNANLNALEQETFRFYLTELKLTNVKEISISPVYIISTGPTDSTEKGKVSDAIKLETPVDGIGGSGMFVELGLSGFEEADYSISSSSDNIPEFRKAKVNPLDVQVGETQTFTVEVYSPNGIKNVTSFTELDHSNVTFIFEKIGEDEEGVETWETSWVAYDTHVTEYRTNITAEDNEGNTNSHILTWTDNCAGINHGTNWVMTQNCQIGSGVGGLDAGNIDLNGYSLQITGGTFVWTDGYSIDLTDPGSSITIDGTLKKSNLWYDDTDGDGYAQNNALVEDPASTKAGYVRASSALGTSDCNDANVGDWVLKYDDTDGDGWCSSATQYCVGNEAGYSTGCNQYSDCNDNDDWLQENLYDDTDGDGWCSSATQYCVGAGEVGFTSSCTSFSDCDDTDDYLGPEMYRDLDSDGYCPSSTKSCVEIGGSPGYVDSCTNGYNDCYDYYATSTNAELAYPGSTYYGSTDRGDGSYDYNCDGSLTRQYTLTSGSCSTCTSLLEPCNTAVGAEGWTNSIAPLCGVTSTYITSPGVCRVGFDTNQCVENCLQGTRTQRCR